MKSKKNSKVEIIYMNCDRSQFLSIIPPDQEKLMKFISKISSKNINIEGFPGWRIQVKEYENHIVFKVICPNNILILSLLVNLDESSSEESWKKCEMLYNEFHDFFPDIKNNQKISDGPTNDKWICMILYPLMETKEYSLDLIKVGSAVLQQAETALFYLQNMKDFKRDKKGSIPKSDNLPSESGGANILSCDYFGSEHERLGKPEVLCAGETMKIKWPLCLSNAIDEMRSATDIVISSGVTPGNEGLKIVFYDNSIGSLEICMDNPSILDLFPADPVGNYWKLEIWTWKDGKPQKVLCKRAIWHSHSDSPNIEEQSQKFRNFYAN